MIDLTKEQFLAVVKAIRAGRFILKDAIESEDTISEGSLQAVASVPCDAVPAPIEVSFEIRIYIPSEDVSLVEYARRCAEGVADMVEYELCCDYLVDEVGEKTALGEQLPELFSEAGPMKIFQQRQQ